MRHLLAITRNHFYLRIFLTFQIFSFSAISISTQAQDVSLSLVQAIDSLCILQMEAGHFPGLAISVGQADKPIWSKGYGYANLEDKVPVNPKSHLFRIGSVSKSITAFALGRGTEKGLLDLDAPISKYYEACPDDKGQLTLRQLGGHLGGIRHYKGFEFLSNLHYQDVIAPLEVFIHDTLLCHPNEKFNYSTYGWTLISAVMELGMHKPFLQIIQEEISSPLGLSQLKADLVDSVSYPRVKFYENQNGQHIHSPQVDLSNKWAGGGFLCSAEDLARFGLALVEQGYLTDQTITTLTTSQSTIFGEKTNYGIGFGSGVDKQSNHWFGHSGGSLGGTSMMLIYPELDLVVITLVNMSGAKMSELAWKIADMVHKDQSKK